MSVTLTQAFEQIIEKKYRLKKFGNMFEIEEKSSTSTNRFLKIGGSLGFGFSLDQDGRHPWGFIVDGPLEGIVSVCDGIIILNYENENYIIVVDLKSTKAGSKAYKQVTSGIYLCEWLCDLLKLNRHLIEEYKFIGVVCKTRGTVSKGTSRKGVNAEVNRDYGIPLVVISNPGTIHIKELLPLI